MSAYLSWCEMHLRRFRLRQDGKKGDACCPIHEDRNPSMIVNIATGWAECKSGNCGFNGPLRKLAEQMGVSMEGLDMPRDWRSSSLGEPEETYIYKTAEGDKHARVLRFPGKKFRQQRWASGDWEWKAPAFSLPYRLDRLHVAEPDRLILWVEGEKDVGTAEWFGFTATTSPGGSDGLGRLDVQALGVLVGRNVVVLNDNDEAGRKYAARVRGLLRKVGARVRVLNIAAHWPGGEAKQGADLTDWEQAGGTRQQLEALIAALPAGAGEEMLAPEEPEAPAPRRVHAQPKSTWQPVEEPILLADGLLQLAKRIEEGKQDEGAVDTGFPDLDRVLKGLKPQQLILVGARPAMGKSSFGQAVCYHVADNYGPVLQATLEMSNEECVLRSVSMITRVREDDMTRDTPLAAWEKAQSVPLYLYDRPCKIEDLEALVDWFHDRHPNMAMLGVDYLGQAVEKGGRLNGNDATAKVSGGLVNITKNHKIPALALHQLSRDVEKRDNKRPIPSDLRDSGALEQDAHKILFLYRDDYYNPRSEDPGVAEVIIAKNRGGPTGMVRLGWDGPTYRFFSLARDDESARHPRNPAFPDNDDDFDTYGLDVP